MVSFPLTKPLKICCCISFSFFGTQTFSSEWSQKDHLFLCYFSIGRKPKLYNYSLLFPMPSQTHTPLSLNTLTPSSQIFQSGIQGQRGLVCFRDQKLSGKKRTARTQRMEKSKYGRNWSLKSHTKGKNCFAFPPISEKHEDQQQCAELKGIPIVTCMIKQQME